MEQVSEWGEGREGQGQVLQDLLGWGRTWAFTPREVGSPEGLWTEEGWDVTQVLTGVLWLWGEDRLWGVRVAVHWLRRVMLELDQEEAEVTVGVFGVGFEGRADRTCYILPRSLADDPTRGDS